MGKSWGGGSGVNLGLEILALSATASLDLANGLNQLCTSNSLKQLRVVQSKFRPVFANPPPCRIKIVVESLDPLGL